MRHDDIGACTFLGQSHWMADKGNRFALYLCNAGQFITFENLPLQRHDRVARITIGAQPLLQGVAGPVTARD